jgi:hypothetical protein
MLPLQRRKSALRVRIADGPNRHFRSPDQGFKRATDGSAAAFLGRHQS